VPQLFGHAVSQRRFLTIVFGAQTLQYRIAGMHNEYTAPHLIQSADKITHHIVRLVVIKPQAVFNGNRNGNRILHGLDAIGHQARLGHQACAKRAFLNTLRWATAIQVDFVVSPLLASPRRRGQGGRLAAAKLQGNRMLCSIKIK
tara:strand:+ start:460 stop:894 length:435 start_codon:yes stop_codon:yes gene_type:complete